MKKYILAGFLCLLPMMVFAMGGMPTTGSTEPLIGKQAPEFTLARLKGEASNFTNARAGKKAVIIFWATWCPHCHEELARLSKTIGEIEQKGIKILLVDVGETKEEVKAYFDNKGYDFNSFLDEENALQEPYAIVGVPTVVFVNEQGIVKSVLHDFPDDFEMYFK